MGLIDLHFPVAGTSLPADHGYDLYAALSRLVPRCTRMASRFGLGRWVQCTPGMACSIWSREIAAADQAPRRGHSPFAEVGG